MQTLDVAASDVVLLPSFVFASKFTVWWRMQRCDYHGWSCQIVCFSCYTWTPGCVEFQLGFQWKSGTLLNEVKHWGIAVHKQQNELSVFSSLSPKTGMSSLNVCKRNTTNWPVGAQPFQWVLEQRNTHRDRRLWSVQLVRPACWGVPGQHTPSLNYSLWMVIVLIVKWFG